MLTIYRASEAIDKETYICAALRETPRHTILLVPDQYTLEAERQIMNKLGTRVLFDIEVLSLSRLGFRLMKEDPEGGKTYIDKYGRHMLISQILMEKNGEFSAFRGFADREAFVETVNDFVSQLKQFSLAPADLTALASSDLSGLLTRKLHDLAIIYEAYQEKIKGKYTDAEDLIDTYTEKIARSRLIGTSDIWIYGFDSFTPKNMTLIGALIRRAPAVNLFLTYDPARKDEAPFALGGILSERFAKLAEDKGGSRTVDIQPAREQGRKNLLKRSALRVLEQKFYDLSFKAEKDKAKKENPDGIALYACTDPRAEAETAASCVLSLLREKKYRMRDIVILCNDPHISEEAVRVFDEYGLDVFNDAKRPILSSPIATYILGLIELVAFGYRTGDFFRLLKTGFGPLTYRETEELENYAEKYGIKGTMWKKPLERGVFEYGREGLDRLEAIRAKAMAAFASFEKIYRESETTDRFVQAYYAYLVSEGALAASIGNLATDQRKRDLQDEAEETEQIWSSIMSLLSQIVDLCQGQAFHGKSFAAMLKSGLAQMEIGVLPPRADDMMLGTTERSRYGDIKALIILGANDGLLPLTPEEDPLFSDEECEKIRESGYQIGRDEEIRRLEETTALYRNLAAPTENLILLYSLSGFDGEEMRRSEIVNRIQELFPSLPIQKDVRAAGRVEDMIGGTINTARQYTAACKILEQENKEEAAWSLVGAWLKARDPRLYQTIERGLTYDGLEKGLSADMSRTLFASAAGEGPFVFSPSQLEKFSRCPFAHFISYGLKPDERRVYEVSGRELGDLYHTVLMKVSRRLSEEKRWETVTEKEMREMIHEIIEKEGQVYRDALFMRGKAEEYWLKRAEDSCFYVVDALVRQARQGSIDKSLYEVAFGRGKPLPPICKDLTKGKAYIEGKIDRLDFLPGDRVKIIDYKTGRESFDREEVIKGYRLQLMLYLEAAGEGRKKPAGVFYFLISEPRVDMDRAGSDEEEKISDLIRKSFRLDGIMVEDPAVIQAIGGDFDRESEVVPLRRNSKGGFSDRSGILVSKEDFADLCDKVEALTRTLCEDLTGGRIAIHPKKSGKNSACDYCPYHGICRFDTSFAYHRYDVVK